MLREPISFVAGKLHCREGFNGQSAKASKSHFTGQAGVKRVTTPSGVDRLPALWLKTGKRVLYRTLCSVEDLEQQSRLTDDLLIHHVARRGSSNHASTPVVKRVNAGPLDALQYSSDSGLLSKTSITPCGARGLREIMDVQGAQ